MASSLLLNTTTASAATTKASGGRPRHATQPEGKLIPATMEIDEEGNPSFFYPESTPQKGAPKIVTPRHIMDRLAINNSNRSASSRTVTAVQQQHADDQSERYHEDEDENGSLTSKGSISKLKLKLRLKGSKKKESSKAPLSPLRMSRAANKAVNQRDDGGVLNKGGLHRNSSDTGTASTRSLSSRTTDDLFDQQQYAPSSAATVSVEDDSSVHREEKAKAPLSIDIPSTAVVVPEETPPQIASLKSAMETAGLSSKTRRAVAPALQQKRPKSKNLVSAVRPGSTRSSAADQMSVASHQSRSSRRPSSTRSAASSSKSVFSTTSSNHPGNKDFKVFLLLLHPSSKIFELIQLYFNPTTTTIRDVISMIPANATEAALGVQDYNGLCRPQAEDKDDREIANLDLLVQNHDNMKHSAQVVREEILVAVPVGYSVHKIAKLSQQILVNPRIQKLLKNSDPLAAKSKRKKRSSRKDGSSRRSSRSSSSRKVSVKVDNVSSPTMSVQCAMENAAAAASAANAAVHELHLPNHRGSSLMAAAGKKYRYPQGRRISDAGSNSQYDPSNADCSMSLESALRSVDSSFVTKTDCSFTDASETSYSMRSYGNQSYEQSVDDSYTTWSKSLDTSFQAGPAYTGAVNASFANVNASFAVNASMSATAPLRRNKRQMRMIRRAVVCVAGVLIVPYFSDASGYAMRHVRVDALLENPFGMTGLFQVVVAFFVLVKFQFLCTMPPKPLTRGAVTQCPFMKLRASILAAHSQGQR